jgi:hypothetical protein
MGGKQVWLVLLDASKNEATKETGNLLEEIRLQVQQHSKAVEVCTFSMRYFTEQLVNW